MSLQVNPERQWQKILAAGLCPEIKDFATYEAKTAEQLALAYKAVLEQPILSPGPADAAAVHGIIFEGVHPGRVCSALWDRPFASIKVWLALMPTGSCRN